MASSRRQTTQYNHYLRVRNGLQSIYAQAIAFRWTHATILEKRSALFATNSYKRLTVYYTGYMAGLDDGLMADIWRNHIAWCLGPSTGPTRQAHTEWTEEMSALCRIPGALYGGHFWLNDDDKPTDKAFTDYACTNAERTAQ